MILRRLPEIVFKLGIVGVSVWVLATAVGVLPDVEPTLNWVRLAQRFPVRVVLEPPDPDHPYRMGNTAVVTIKGFPEESGEGAAF